MSSSILAAVLGSLLFFSWILFLRLYLRNRAFKTLRNRRLDENRRQVQEQAFALDSAISMLTEIYQVACNSSGEDARSALSKIVVESGCRIMKCMEGSLMLVDAQSNELVLTAARGPHASEVGSFRLNLGQGVAGRVAATGKSILSDNVDTDVRFVQQARVEYHLKSLAAFPLRVKDRTIGVLSVTSNESPLPFSDRDLRYMEMVADHAALSFENMELSRHLNHFYLEMIETLAKSLDLKEYESNTRLPDHDQNRVFARAIAERMNLPESIVKYIEFAALICGIGKIGIAESILRKPGKLTQEEFEKIKRHPEIGKDILSKVRFLSPAVSMILYHQERWDGKGYPAGLKGEEIPLGARIVSATNAYHAMTSERPYRPALNREQAVNELKRGAGTQFDPRVIEVFLKVLEKESNGSGESQHGGGPVGPVGPAGGPQKWVRNL